MRKLYFFIILCGIWGTSIASNLSSLSINSAEFNVKTGLNNFELVNPVPVPPPISGNFTVGSTGDYASLTDAISAITTDGIDGPVVFSILNGTYNEQVVIGAIPGASETNTITFQAQSGNSSDVIVTYSAVSASDNFVVLLENTAHLIFTNITFQAGGTNYARTIVGQNEVYDILFENCLLQSPITSSTSTDRGNVILAPSLSGDVRFINNTITGGSTGIYYKGNTSSSSRAPGTEFRQNIISDVYNQGIYLQYHTDAIIENNTISLIAASYSGSDGAELNDMDGAFRFLGNRVTGAKSYGIYMVYCTATAGDPAIFANNFIMSYGSTQSLYMYYNSNQKIYHNNINNTSTSASAVAFYYNGQSSSGNIIKNNIVKANTGFAIDVDNSTGLLEMDYNNFYTSGTYLARWGNSDITDLTAWKTASSFDTNSLSFDPQFNSDTDLYASSPALANAGTPLPEVTTDIDGTARKTTPTIGANEYDAASLAPLSGIYTIDPAGSGNRNFTSFAETIEAMLVNGIDGAVIFQVASGNYAEQVLIPDFSGGSSINTVSYEAASGNAADVIISHTASSDADNFVVRLDNASDIILRNLTIQALGTTYARTIHAKNRANNILVEGCTITSPVTSSTSTTRGNVILAPSLSGDVRFINNTITGGSTGIYYKGNTSSSSRAPGTEFRQNIISDVYNQGIYLQYHTDAIIENNTISLIAASYSGSDGAELNDMDGAFRFLGNRVTGAKSYGIYMVYCTATAGDPAIFANNFIMSYGSTQSLYMYYNSNQKIYHNNINNTSTSASAVAFYYNGQSSSGNIIKNNIVKANNGFAIDVDNSTGLLEMDYNNFYTSGTFLARWGNSNITDLLAWKTASSFDNNSLSFDPQYVSDTDLTPQSPSLTEAGENLTSEVSTDINGNPRTVPVSIGANEFGVASTPLAGDYTIDPAGSGDRNFTTFAEASEALRLSGISAEVRFLVADNTFNEQVNLGAVSGASFSATISFESASGNPNNSIIEHTDNYTLKLVDAEHYSFKNLTLKTTGEAQVIQVRNRANNLLFEGNIIISPVETGTSSVRKGMDISPTFAQDIRIIDNTFTDGIYGLYFRGSSNSNKASGTIISGNSFNNNNFHSIFLEYQLSPVIAENTVQTNSSANQISIYVSNTSGGLTLTKNRVSSNDGNALRLDNVQGTSASPNLVSNNFLHSDGVNRAIYISNASYLQFYHNAVWNQNSGSAFQYVSSGSDNSLVNNIFQSATGYALNISNGSAFSQIDFNNLFTGGSYVGKWGNTNISDLSSWQTTTGKSANSLTVDAEFLSVNDLTPQTDALASNGFDLTSVINDDINGNLRTVPVSIGAVEYNAVSGIDLAVNSLINPVNNCILTDAEIVSVQIENTGTSFAENIILGYEFNNQAAVEESIPAGTTIAPGQKYTFEFTQTVDLSVKGDYPIRLYVKIDDENLTNNELLVTISHYPEVVGTVTPAQQICLNEFAVLEATGGESYLWSTGETTPQITINPTETTEYKVTITDANQCSVELSSTVEVLEIPVLDFVGDENYVNEFVHPIIGTDETEFTFRIKYTDTGNVPPANGFPKLTLSSFIEDLEFEMTEEDGTDTDFTDGKIYSVLVSGLTNDADWVATIEASNGVCQATNISGNSPLVSTDFLDIAIFATDILFNNDEPALNENFTITANIRNTSDYDAENFEVQVYDDSILIHTETINFVGAQQVTNFEFDYAFTVFGYHEIKVVIDSQDELLEKNELNNFAIRFYALPEGISVTASTNKTTYYLGETIYVNGQAVFTGLDAAITPPVKNAIVRWTVSDGRVKTTYTNTTGGIYTSFSPFAVTGNYTISGEVDDGRFVEPFGPLSLSVVDNPNNVPLADLVANMTVDIPARGYYLLDENVTGVASVENTGTANAENFVFRYSSCEAELGEITIIQLEPGEKIEYPFSTILTDVNSCDYLSRCSFIANADVLNQITETKEYDNTSQIFIKQRSEKVELEPVLSGNSTFNLEDPYRLTFGIRNTGGISLTQATNIKVYIDNVEYAAYPINSLDVCERWYQIDDILFTTTDDKVIVVNVDEPLGSGSVTENDESNNSSSITITYSPKEPDLVTRNYNLKVNPKYPALNEDFEILGIFSNSGGKDIITSFTNNFSVTEEGVLRNQSFEYPNGLNQKTTDTSAYTTQIATYGDHLVEFELDINNEVDEQSENNNFVSMPLCADLVAYPNGSVWNGGFQVYTNQNLGIYARNLGLFVPSDVSVAFFLDDVLIATTTINEVPTTYNNYYGTPGFAPHVFTEPGTYTLKVVVDYLDEYEECDETNNEYSREITITTPGPDLRVLSAYISPTKLNPDLDEPINLFVSYDNIGVVPAGPFKVRLNIDGLQIGEDVLVQGVAAGEDGTVAITETYSSSIGGIKTIEAIIDADNEQADPDRNNNIAERTIFVGDAPNLYFVSFELNNDCPENGEDITIDAIIGNDGDIETTATITFYHKVGDVLEEISSQFITVGPKGQTSVNINATVLSNTFELFAEITDATPFEYDQLDNTYTRGYCTVSTDVVLATSVVGSGIITRNPNENIFELDSEVTLEAVPANGWSFANWSGDATGSQNPLILTMDANKNVTANFEEQFRVDLDIVNESCVDAADGSLEVSIFAGTSPFTIEWYKNSELLIGESGTTLSNLSAGDYEVRVTDSNNETVSEIAEIIVSDLEKPHILVQSDIVVILDDTGTATLTVNEVDGGSYDNCAIEIQQISQTSFNCDDVGTVDLLYEIFDTNGNKQESNFQITVVDETNPEILDLPSDIMVDNDESECGAIVSWIEPTAIDNCQIQSFTSDFPSGDVFPVGTTTVTYTATDVNGNSQTASFDIIVTDNEKPLISAQTDLSQTSDEGLCSALVEIIPATASDNCAVDGDPIGIRSDNLALTDPYPVGTTTIKWNVEDTNGNSAIEVEQIITITDDELPVITDIPTNISISNEIGLCNAVVNWSEPVATDNCDIQSFTSDYNSGTAFPVGTTTVTYTATDIHGNTQTASFEVEVIDNESPVITGMPGNILVPADFTACNAVVSWSEPVASDNCDIQSFTSDYNSGAAFPVGTTTVTYIATDIHGNTQTASFEVEVIDNEIPEITGMPGNILVPADFAACNAVVSWSEPVATDNCDIQSFTSDFNSGAAFPVGTTTVTYTATDIHGNTQTASFEVEVIDNESPEITGMPDNILVPADFTACNAVVSWSEPVASDNCDIQSFTSDFNSGAAFPVGTTTVTYTATDIHGNTQTASFEVEVIDNESPVANNVSLPVLNDDCEITELVPPTATDNCDGQIIGEYNVTLPIKNSTTIIWTFTDLASNISTQSQDVEILTGELNWFADTDGDGFGDANSSVVACEQPAGYVADNSDCDDADASVYPGAVELCDGIDNDCDGQTDEDLVSVTWYADTDGDGLGDPNNSVSDCSQPAGFVNNADDCDDTDASVTTQTTWFADTDGDGFGDANSSVVACEQPAGYVADNSDCDDAVASVYPGASEICDGIDNNCDGLTDDEDPGITGQTIWYLDSDNDGYGDPANSIQACSQPVGYVEDNTDNCPDTYNPEQIDLDGNNIGDACEACATPIEIVSIVTPLDPNPMNTTIVITAEIVGDLTELTWDWGDGSLTTESTNELNQVETHTYTEAGVYRIQLTALDICGNTHILFSDYIPIYDPSGGFVTGGGWIMSPPGAYKADETITGKANFGFVAKYKKGSKIPNGHTEFHFKTADLKFNSTEYEEMRLIISGKRAQYKGYGQINNEGDYGFLLSVIDGQQKGGDGLDKFRIKIWNRETDEMVYDNNIDQTEENADPATVIGGGSIVIHKPKGNKSGEIPSAEIPEKEFISVNVWPNPFAEKLKFQFTSAEATDALLELYDINGAKIETLFDKYIQLNETIYLEYTPKNIASGVVIYRLKLNGKLFTERRIYNKQR